MKKARMGKGNDIDYKKLVVKTIKNNYSSFFIGLIIFTSFLVFSISTIANNSLLTANNNTNKQDVVDTTPQITYIVKPGDDFSIISEKMYGATKYANNIIQANKIQDPNIIYEGQKLIIPKISQKPKGQISSISTKKVIHTTDTYTVKKGDFLWKIAEECYGDGNMMRNIIKANNLTNIENIEIGKVLKIPRN